MLVEGFAYVLFTHLVLVPNKPSLHVSKSTVLALCTVVHMPMSNQSIYSHTKPNMSVRLPLHFNKFGWYFLVYTPN